MNFKTHLIAVFGLFLIWFCLFESGQAQQVDFADLEYPYAVKHQELSNGQTIAYIDEGQGPAVILIHGLGSYIPAWKRNIPALKTNHRVIALDLPGYGKSSKNVEKYSIPFFAETVAQLQDSLGIEQATWIGHSMGSQIALEAAATYPDKISKLVLISPAGFEQFSAQEGAMMSQFVTPASIKATPDSIIRETFRAAFHQFPDEAQFMADDRVALRGAKDFDLYAEAYAGSVQAMLEGPVFQKLSGIETPALIIYGRQDALIPNQQIHPNLTTEQVAQKGAEQLPNSTLKMVGDAGHFVHFEQPTKVNNLLTNFLSK